MRRRVVIAILVAGTLILVGAISGPLMSQVEVPSYAVTRAEGPIEVRAYSPMVVASVTVRGTRGAAISDGFKILASYIFGGNDASKKIEMTAPVMQERARDVPEGQPDKPGTWKVRFVMPRGFSLETLPKPRNSQIEMTAAPRATYAVIRFSGFARATVLNARTNDLMTFVERAKLQPIGSPIYAFYNPPWTLPFFRRNEIMVAVAPGSQPGGSAGQQ